MNRQSMQHLFDIQRNHTRLDTMPGLAVRRDRLQRLMTLLQTEERAVIDVLMQDFTYRSERQSKFAEIVTTVRQIRHCQRRLKRWMRPSRRRAGLPFGLAGGKAAVHWQPLGVIGIVSPWNFPVNLCFGPLAGVFAAGNVAMLKPSELTPAVSEWMAEAVPRYFDETELAVVTGDVDTARQFTALAFDHLVFTGGERAAREVMTAAAQNLTPVTLELGGKSPVIICSDKRLDLAAARLLFGKVFNAGQICLAPDTAWVQESLLDNFIAALQKAAGQQLRNLHDDGVDVIHSGHRQRLQQYVQQAKEAGCKVIPLAEAPPRACAMAPTLVIDPPPQLAICQEEIFGPVLLVRTYQHLDVLLQQLRQLPKPLALYCFGADRAQRQQIMLESCSGGLCFDDVIMHYTISDLPFGGVGNSGMGCYHGRDGFQAFSHGRAVFQQSPLDIGKLIRPPYGKTFDHLAAFMQRYL